MAGYFYNKSTFDADGWIAELNREIQARCKDTPLVTDEDKKKLVTILLRRTGMAAFQGYTRKEGTPVAAMLVDFHTQDGVPLVVGFGNNHRSPMSDPSAHGEIVAIRDTVNRMGKTDLSGLTLVTSCECCPMCMAAAAGCNVEQIYFANTHEDNKKFGFPDGALHRLMSSGGVERHSQKASNVQEAEKRLARHDAMVEMTYNGKKYAYYGDYNPESPDPTALPIVQAIRQACLEFTQLDGIEKNLQLRILHCQRMPGLLANICHIRFLWHWRNG